MYYDKDMSSVIMSTVPVRKCWQNARPDSILCAHLARLRVLRPVPVPIRALQPHPCLLQRATDVRGERRVFRHVEGFLQLEDGVFRQQQTGIRYRVLFWILRLGVGRRGWWLLLLSLGGIGGWSSGRVFGVDDVEFGA